MTTIPSDKLRVCADEALKCHGTAYIFEKRAARIRLKLLLLTFFGIAGPVSIGAIISTYNLNQDAINIALSISGTVAILQLLITLWSVVSGWNDKLAYYLESKSSNYSLASRFIKLFQDSAISLQEFNSELRILERESVMRSDLDNKHDVKKRKKDGNALWTEKISTTIRKSP